MVNETVAPKFLVSDWSNEFNLYAGKLITLLKNEVSRPWKLWMIGWNGGASNYGAGFPTVESPICWHKMEIVVGGIIIVHENDDDVSGTLSSTAV